MKRLLLVAHVFPPAPSPGALRPGYLSRYLPQFGWDVTVLTNSPATPPFAARVISTAQSGGTFEERMRRRLSVDKARQDSLLRRMLRAAKEAVLFPDATAGWIAPAIRAGSELLKRERFDAILSTAHPPSAHVVAWMLAKQTGLPWIADYRDPWAGNAYLHRGFARQTAEEFLERGMLRRANALSTISEPIAGQLRRFHRRRDVAVIPNAYDPADWSGIPNAKPERFDLTFTGSMYGGKRSPELLFKALAEMRAAGEPAAMPARAHFYGPSSENVDAEASAHGLSSIVRRHGTVSRTDAMRAQRASAALLIFLNMDPATASEMGSKYLEYLGARRPIIAFGPPNSVMRSFIANNGLGWFASNVDEAKVALTSAYHLFMEDASEMPPIDTSEISTAPTLAFRFAEQLDRVARDDLRNAV